MNNPKKILIVEDEMLIALNLKRRLSSAGYTVLGMAVSGEQAIRLAEADPPDLALMDVNLLGEMDGIEVAEYLESNYGTPSIYLSAYLPEDLRKRVAPEHPFRYLPKFVQQEELIHAIDDALEAYPEGDTT